MSSHNHGTALELATLLHRENGVLVSRLPPYFLRKAERIARLIRLCVPLPDLRARGCGLLLASAADRLSSPSASSSNSNGHEDEPETGDTAAAPVVATKTAGRHRRTQQSSVQTKPTEQAVPKPKPKPASKRQRRREEDAALAAAIARNATLVQDTTAQAQARAAPGTAAMHRRRQPVGPVALERAVERADLSPDERMALLRRIAFGRLRDQLRAWLGTRTAVASVERAAILAAMHSLVLTGDVEREAAQLAAGHGGGGLGDMALAAFATARDSGGATDVLALHTTVLVLLHDHVAGLAEPCQRFWRRIAASFAECVKDRCDTEAVRFVAAATQRFVLLDRLVMSDGNLVVLPPGGTDLSQDCVKQMAELAVQCNAVPLALALYNHWGRSGCRRARVRLAEAEAALARHGTGAGAGPRRDLLVYAVFEQKRALWHVVALVNHYRAVATLHRDREATMHTARYAQNWLAAARRLHMHDAFKRCTGQPDLIAYEAGRFLHDTPTPGAECDDCRVMLDMPEPELPDAVDMLTVWGSFFAISALFLMCSIGHANPDSTKRLLVRCDDGSVAVTTVDAWTRRALTELAAVLRVAGAQCGIVRVHTGGGDAAEEETDGHVPDDSGEADATTTTTAWLDEDGFFTGDPADAPPLSDVPPELRARQKYMRLVTSFYTELLTADEAWCLVQKNATSNASAV